MFGECFIGRDKVCKWAKSAFQNITKSEVQSILKRALAHRLLKVGSEIGFPYYSKVNLP
jgi:hypothetical protein